MLSYRPLVIGFTLSVAFAAAQAPAPARPAPRGMKIPEALAIEDHAGYESIFDGTLKNWDGDPKIWRVEDNAIVGETTRDNALKLNTFIIYRGDKPKDFALKLEFRMNSTNSGVQYRSVELPDVGKWVLKGYQADMDFANTYTGMLYEERGRGIVALRGQMTQIETGKNARVIGQLQDGDELKGYIKINGWNQFHVIARGNCLTHVLNGHVTAVMIDDDTEKRAMEGLIGLQMHVGPPMKVEFRNIFLKKY